MRKRELVVRAAAVSFYAEIPSWLTRALAQRDLQRQHIFIRRFIAHLISLKKYEKSEYTWFTRGNSGLCLALIALARAPSVNVAIERGRLMFVFNENC